MNIPRSWIGRILLLRAILSLLGTATLVGCVSTISSMCGLEKLEQREGLGHFYYIGSKNGYDYFATKYFLEPTKSYRFRATDQVIQHTFPMTKEKSKWVPYVIDLGRNTKGFRGEPEQLYQTTNSADSKRMRGK